MLVDRSSEAKERRRTFRANLKRNKLKIIGERAVRKQFKKSKVDIVFEEEPGDENFLNLSGVPNQLKLRSGLHFSNHLYVRDCYDYLIQDIITSLHLKRNCGTVAVVGTAGIGKSSMLLYCLKKLLDNPANLLCTTRSFYFQTVPGEIWLYKHIHGSKFSIIFVDKGKQLDATIPLFADMEAKDGSPKEHAGILLIFTSFQPARYSELIKNGWCKIMPTWSAQEQIDFFSSDYFDQKIAARAYNNIKYFGGSIRNNINVALHNYDPEIIIEAAIQQKGAYVCDRFFNVGFGGIEAEISDMLVHRNPAKNSDSSYIYDAYTCTFSFASVYVLRRLLQLNNNMMATGAKRKYSTSTYHGSQDGEEFELLCLHGFQISDVVFKALSLTSNRDMIDVTFPPKEVLVLNWRTQENYLKRNVLYIPPYGNLESGDSFCLIEINRIWTLIILQCTISENHPVKQNGIKVIHDCYSKKSNLQVDETVIMFMIPSNSKLNSQQSLVIQKRDGTLQNVQRSSIHVNAQYKIVNTLSIENIPRQPSFLRDVV